MSAEVIVRRARRSDYAVVNELSTALAGSAANRRPSFGAVLASPDHELIVAELDGIAVGFAHLLIYTDLSHGAVAGEVLGLVVQQDRRGKGIGRALLRAVCDTARGREVGELHINTEQDNRAALRLYQSEGAQVVGLQLEIEMSRDS